ncbi:iron complex outermembrane receptor protein [Flavobacterium endophyticum]|uniref:Iron complex outermembrane receptor protein n=1 Tax=Flavobacterium endophyticum TaxID=1540163 RepID=A0A495MR65_9FLAO|nr:TonB-dependent receptor [Flavobacterium endophyticum]RKS26749.1 iron complex outermembrane receptor protein [Flavobacterium endophyticum]
MKTIYKKLLLLVLLLPFSVLAQNTLNGNVRDEVSGLPLPGVSVTVQGGTNGATTDFDGNFTLSGVKAGDVISFSFLGYKSTTITYSSQNTISVVLQEDASQLDEVVVVGYGSVKKKDATGAVEVISSKDFNRGLNATAENLLNGRVAGLTISTGGAPGSGSTIRIRGGSSLNAKNDPLIVIDGLPLDNEDSGGATSKLSSINPNDIESFSILKDASATAIYGSRASNGVIIITTKKGSQGEMQVSFNSVTTVNTLAKKVDVLSADQFRALVNQVGNPTQIGLLGTANTDWQDEIFQTSMSVDNNLSIRGNLFGVMPARLSIGYTSIPGLLRTGEFKRTTTSIALNPSFFDNHLKINLNANISWQDNRFAEEGAIGNALSFDPTQSVYDPTSYFGGYFEWLEPDGDRVVTGAQQNPVSLLNQRRNVTDNRKMYGNFQVDYKLHFFEDIRAVVNVGFDKQDGNGTNTLAPFSPAGFQTGSYSGGTYQNFGSHTYFNENKENKLLDAYLVYTKEIGKFNLDVTGGYSYQNFKWVGFSTGNVYDPNAQPDVFTRPTVNLQSYFGRMNLGYDDKYLLTLNYRRDGTSRFSKENRWGNFPGAAFAWKISQESFLKDVSVISDLKLRLGWGITGQQDINDGFAYIERYTTGTTQAQYQFGNVFVPVGRPEGYNKGLKWEETETRNIGIDYGFFNNSLRGSLDLYEKKSTDLLARVPFPDGANLANEGFRNYGDFTTKGIEFSVSYDIFRGEGFNWTSTFNATYNDQEITDIPSDNAVGDIDGGGGNKIQINSVGYNPNAFYVYEQVYDSNGKPVEGVYVDRNQDGVISTADQYRYKKPNADFTFGMMNNMSYKQFDLSFAWRASLGNYMYNNVASNKGVLQAGVRYNDVISNINSDYLNSGFLLEGNNRLFSDYYVQNASWFKLDNITLGYTVRNPFATEKSKLRIYGAVQNVFTITDYDGVDPEIFGGIDKTIYPRPRMFMLGFNLDF